MNALFLPRRAPARGHSLLSGALAGALLCPALAAAEQPYTLDSVEVSAKPTSNTTEDSDTYIIGVIDSASGLQGTPRETPRSVSVITRQQLDDFNATDTRQALSTATGVTVEAAETDRIYYTSRGFDIKSFQIDGVNQPLLDASAAGSYMNYDTAIYDHVEVLRGANGVMGGTGTPSATINFVRKKPTSEFQASLGAGYGSWDKYRLQADVSGALNKNKTVRGRFVTAYQDGNSYLDRYSQDRTVVYGVVDIDLSDRDTLTLGHSYQEQHANAPMWGALPMLDANGNQLRYPRHASTSAGWTYYDVTLNNSFAELTHFFDSGWQAVASLSYTENEDDNALLYFAGAPDPTTPGSDLYYYAGSYPDRTTSWQGDVRARGPFRLFGREHQLLMGVNSWYEKDRQLSYDAVDAGSELGDPDQLLNGDFPKPQFERTPGADIYDKAKTAYLSTRLSLTDPLSVTLGARYLDYQSGGLSYGSETATHEIDTALFAGLVYDLSRHYSVYASTGRIFQPQAEVDAQRQRLPSAEGVSNELGLKGVWFEQRLNASLSVFDTRQKDLALADGTIPGSADTAYAPTDVTSRGYELDVAGELTEQLDISAGLSQVRVENDQGVRERRYVPKHRAHLLLAYDVPQWQGVRLGTRLRWQSKVSYTSAPGMTFSQDDYTLVDLMLHYDISKHWSTTLNINNLTDRKHLTSLLYDQSYYGEPRNVNLAVNWKL
ncbi:TonB-dependent siderophore receptor [Alloalcanivorax mobilis]|uniref:TonB-dependent siderophore receptor n=1 Tax=Alloalcanivorax mobilis TaxID=2019569 RepID=UPI000B5B22B2|nr:TonB-dependent siderophore receptor [Alloalcanivorax mobilis]ASK35435.1 TonB-dependent siderophore receptor [Alcanivorax sp. N3-2A]|tara:strand:+ start:35473 stop:37626 length:2154 start_codon:yes stop_codon:yes gene_type:complete